jgi:hypothetical protein
VSSPSKTTMVRDSIGPECTGELRGEKTTSGKLATLTAQRRKGLSRWLKSPSTA